jgi:hypothetical protein
MHKAQGVIHHLLTGCKQAVTLLQITYMIRCTQCSTHSTHSLQRLQLWNATTVTFNNQPCHDLCSQCNVALMKQSTLVQNKHPLPNMPAAGHADVNARMHYFCHCT